MQVGLAADGAQIDLERQRQAQQRAVVVNVGQTLAAPQHQADTFQVLKQCLERRLHFEHHSRAQGRHLPGVAAELKGVAQALLGVQKYRLARQRLFAQPQGLAEVAKLVLVELSLPAPFVVLPALRKV
ncbi:MAG: hypothetical protein B7Y09_14085, partial [Polaromonas sp. 24-63-21]